VLSKLRRRVSYANVASTLALTLALGGSAYAATSLPSNSVGTKQLKNNAVISSKVSNGSLLARDFKTGQLPRGPKGPKGDKGATGAKGAKGAAGPGIRWALVKGSDGSVLLQSGGITATRQSTGVYYVDFGIPVSGHAISVTIHSATGNFGTVTGAIPCSGTLVPVDPDTFACAAHNKVGEVLVGTANYGTGNPSDQDFYIEVFN
jgi:hypothetical protein